MNDEPDYDDYSPPVEPLSGQAQGGGTDVLSDTLLDLIGLVVRANIMMAEASEDEFRGLRHRVATLKYLVHQLPEKPSPRRKVGFKLRGKKK